MRQIKFRAWHIKDKCYCESVSCGAMSIVGYDIHEIFNNDIILEQFTGLCDKDGKEIYEGDIILNNGSKWVITWSDDAACYMMRHINDPTPGNENIFLWESKNSEAIGNIHEGKE